jgi:glutamate racemase
MGDTVKLISPGEEVAKYLKKKLTSDMCHSNIPDKEQYSFYVSDSIESFEELGSIFLETKINGQVNKIDIEKY